MIRKCRNSWSSWATISRAAWSASMTHQWLTFSQWWPIQHQRPRQRAKPVKAKVKQWKKPWLIPRASPVDSCLQCWFASKSTASLTRKTSPSRATSLFWEPHLTSCPSRSTMRASSDATYRAVRILTSGCAAARTYPACSSRASRRWSSYNRYWWTSMMSWWSLTSHVWFTICRIRGCSSSSLVRETPEWYENP